MNDETVFRSILVIATGLIVAGFIGWTWSIAWAVGDARERGQNGGWVLLLCILVGPLAAVFWLIIRPALKLRERSPESYHEPDTALTAASQLDMIGEWEAAAELFRMVIERWPEHAHYATASLDVIREKQSLG